MMQKTIKLKYIEQEQIDREHQVPEESRQEEQIQEQKLQVKEEAQEMPTRKGEEEISRKEESMAVDVSSEVPQNEEEQEYQSISMDGNDSIKYLEDMVEFFKRFGEVEYITIEELYRDNHSSAIAILADIKDEFIGTDPTVQEETQTISIDEAAIVQDEADDKNNISVNDIDSSEVESILIGYFTQFCEKAEVSVKDIYRKDHYLSFVILVMAEDFQQDKQVLQQQSSVKEEIKEMPTVETGEEGPQEKKIRSEKGIFVGRINTAIVQPDSESLDQALAVDEKELENTNIHVKPSKETGNTHKLYVRDIDCLSRSEIRQHFSKFGNIDLIETPTNEDYCFVSFQTPLEVLSAAQDTRQTIGSTKVVVKVVSTKFKFKDQSIRHEIENKEKRNRPFYHTTSSFTYRRENSTYQRRSRHSRHEDEHHKDGRQYKHRYFLDKHYDTEHLNYKRNGDNKRPKRTRFP